jgi:hypothetical protein
MIAQQHSSRADIMLLCNLVDCLIFEQRRSCTTKRAVRGDMDAFLFTEVDDFLLREERVVFDLVGGGDNGSLSEELLEVLHRVVCDTDGFYFVWMFFYELFEAFPCLDVVGAVVEIARAVFEFGKEKVVSWNCESQV